MLGLCKELIGNDGVADSGAEGRDDVARGGSEEGEDIEDSGQEGSRRCRFHGSACDDIAKPYRKILR